MRPVNADKAISSPGATGGSPQGRLGVLLAGLAAALGAAIVVAAAVVPVVTLQSAPATSVVTAGDPGLPPQAGASMMTAQPRVTLMAHDGAGVLGLASIPLVVALGVGLLLWYAVQRGSRPAVSAAWVLAVLLTVGGVVGFVTFLIGVVVIPVGVLLMIGCWQAGIGAR